MKDNWKGFALSLAVGLIMGGGVAAAVGERNLQAESARIHERIDRIEADGDKTLTSVINLAVAMARVEEQLKAANAKLDALAHTR
jgi:hypothetical protein